jgi:hypothetical protein
LTQTDSATAIDVADLRGWVTGPVLLPGEDGYAAEAASNNLNNPLVPAVAVGVTSNNHNIEPA